MLDLKISSIKMGDKGLFGLTNAFKEIQQTNIENNVIDIFKGLSLDISHNYITDNAFKAFTRLAITFPFIYSLNLNKSIYLSSKAFEYLL